MTEDDARVTDEMVEAALHAVVPGGAEVLVWLPSGSKKADRTAREIMRAALEAALPPLVDGRAEIVEECARAALAAGNFGDYRREELTADYGQPRFDMMTAIVEAIRALSPPPKSYETPENAGVSA